MFEIESFEYLYRQRGNDVLGSNLLAGFMGYVICGFQTQWTPWFYLFLRLSGFGIRI